MNVLGTGAIDNLAGRTDLIDSPVPHDRRTFTKFESFVEIVGYEDDRYPEFVMDI